MSQIIVSCDVGIVNLAFVKVEVQHFKVLKVLEAFVINLVELPHRKVKRDECKLYHTNDVYDRMQHFLQECGERFEDMDVLLIERQPIKGLVHVEQFLFGTFRDKTHLVSPNAMHKWLNIKHLDYDQRKESTTQYAEQFLKLHTQFQNRDRKHDMADALCILLYWLQKKESEHQKKVQDELKKQQKAQHQKELDELIIQLNNEQVTLKTFLENFKYSSDQTSSIPEKPPVTSKYFS